MTLETVTNISVANTVSGFGHKTPLHCTECSEDTKEGNWNLQFEEEQTTQWPKEKVQKDQQRSTKHTYKTKVRVT